MKALTALTRITGAVWLLPLLLWLTLPAAAQDPADTRFTNGRANTLTGDIGPGVATRPATVTNLTRTSDDGLQESPPTVPSRSLRSPIVPPGAIQLLQTNQDQVVRFVYLVSQDRQVRADFQAAVERAAQEVQQWYARQLNGKTFRLHAPVVEVAHSSQPAAWFSNHPAGNNRDDWGYNNALAEAARLLGTRHNDPRFIWVIYSDGPGDKGRGTSGVAYLPEDDLLGLIGQHPTQKNPVRWVGGLGHELGHAFGLPHPTDTVRDADAIMWAGFYSKYPDQAYLTESDKQTLLRSPFFFDAAGKPVAGEQLFAEKFNYAGGYFGKLPGAQNREWVEQGKAESVLHFQEQKRDPAVIWLKDPSRNLLVQIPVQGGMAKWSTDEGRSWNELYEVRPEKLRP